jgi:hypothetical protein
MLKRAKGGVALTISRAFSTAIRPAANAPTQKSRNGATRYVRVESSFGDGIDARDAQARGANAVVGNNTDYNKCLNNRINQTPGFILASEEK